MGSAHVFVSYTSADRPFADKLVCTLKSAGLRIWYAPRDSKTKMNYPSRSRKRSRPRIASSLSLRKRPMLELRRTKIQMAFCTQQGGPSLPVRTSAIAPASGLALFLQLRHWTDAFGQGRTGAVARLADELVAAQRQSGGSATGGRPCSVRGSATAPKTRPLNPGGGPARRSSLARLEGAR